MTSRAGSGRNARMKWIDLPPVWLAGFIALTYLIGTGLPLVGSEAHIGWVAGLFISAGLVAMGAAVFEMARAKTTVIPHREADALVQSGIFALSRNPIYLGDVLVLVGFVIWFKAPLALLLVPVFIFVIRLRFIEPEETRLAAKFGAAFASYCARTRRWI